MIIKSVHLRPFIISLTLMACSQQPGFKGEVAKVPADYSSNEDPNVEKILDPSSRTVRSIDESFIQSEATGTADILIVIDDSGSMRPYQNNLSTKLSALLVALADTDWQIGVITTSLQTSNGNESCKLKLIKSSDQNRERKFNDAVVAGTSGSSDEQGIRQAKIGLECRENKWVRPGSSIAVLIVTDEEDGSREDFTIPLINYVEQDMARTVGVNAGFYAIFSPPSAPCNVPNATIGTRYQTLLDYKNVSGTINYGRVCEQTYKPTLELISKSIAKLASNFYTLQQIPDVGTVIVSGSKTDGSAITEGDYTVNGQSLVFKKGSEAAFGTTVSVSYQVTSR